MPANAYGVGYPKIDLQTSANGTSWSSSSSFVFSDVDDLLVDPPQFIPVEDVPPIDLADGSTRAFTKGWHFYAEIAWRAHASNALLAFLDIVYDWLRGGTYRRIEYYPHVDCASNYYRVRVKSPHQPEYFAETFGKIAGGLIFEGTELLTDFPYYTP